MFSASSEITSAGMGKSRFHMSRLISHLHTDIAYLQCGISGRYSLTLVTYAISRARSEWFSENKWVGPGVTGPWWKRGTDMTLPS